MYDCGVNFKLKSGILLFIFEKVFEDGFVFIIFVFWNMINMIIFSSSVLVMFYVIVLGGFLVLIFILVVGFFDVVIFVFFVDCFYEVFLKS